MDPDFEPSLTSSITDKYVNEQRNKQRLQRNYERKRKIFQQKELEDEHKFQGINAKLNEDNFFDCLPLLLYFSDDENYSYQLLIHTQLIIDMLARTEDINHQKAMLDILDFEMIEDTETTLYFLKLLPQFPRQILQIYTNYIRKEKSCPNIIFHILESSMLQNLQVDIYKGNQEQNILICKFICAIGMSRPLLEKQVLHQINMLLIQIIKVTDNSQIYDDVIEYLSEYYEIKQNEALARNLYQTFKFIFEDKYSSSDLIMYYIHYLCKHSGLSNQLVKDDNIRAILARKIYQGAQLKLPYQCLLLLMSKCAGYQVIDEKLFNYLISTFQKNRYIQQILILKIVHKYLLDAIQQNPKMHLSRDISNLLQRNLKSKDCELIKQSLNILESMIGETNNHKFVSYFKPIVEGLPESVESKEILNQIEDILHGMDEQY